MSHDPKSDLIVLAPGKDDQAALDGLFARPLAIGIRPIRHKIERHPGRDPGCRLEAPAYSKSALGQFDHAIVLFDREGCGAEQMTRQELEADMESRLANSGWGERAAAIVIDPELENWIWSDSPQVDAALGWRGRSPSLRQWLHDRKMLHEGRSKPTDPKQSVIAALREVNKRRTSNIYKDVAASVSFSRCTDEAFQKLLKTLRGWYAPAS